MRAMETCPGKDGANIKEALKTTIMNLYEAEALREDGHQALTKMITKMMAEKFPSDTLPHLNWSRIAAEVIQEWDTMKQAADAATAEKETEVTPKAPPACCRLPGDTNQ